MGRLAPSPPPSYLPARHVLTISRHDRLYARPVLPVLRARLEPSIHVPIPRSGPFCATVGGLHFRCICVRPVLSSTSTSPSARPCPPCRKGPPRRQERPLRLAGAAACRREGADPRAACQAGRAAGARQRPARCPCPQLARLPRLTLSAAAGCAALDLLECKLVSAGPTSTSVSALSGQPALTS